MGDEELSRWLQRHNNFTSPTIQNEVLQIVSNTIVREIVTQEIHSLPVVQYSLRIDGTQDAAGVEQESFCPRFVDKNLQPREEFIGLCQLISTTGENIASVAKEYSTLIPWTLLWCNAMSAAARASKTAQIRGHSPLWEH